MTTFDESEDVSFRYSAAFTGSWDLIDVDALLLGEVSHRWSRQGFSSAITKRLITWGSSGHLISDLVLDGYCGLWLRWLRCLSRSRSGNFSFLAAIILDGENHVADWDDFVVSKIDRTDFTSGCRWDLGDKFIGKDLAQVLILRIYRSR